MGNPNSSPERAQHISPGRSPGFMGNANPSPERAKHISPGQRPGISCEDYIGHCREGQRALGFVCPQNSVFPALKGRNISDVEICHHNQAAVAAVFDGWLSTGSVIPVCMLRRDMPFCFDGFGGSKAQFYDLHLVAKRNYMYSKPREFINENT